LSLLDPGDVFRPLTPVGFVFPFPARCPSGPDRSPTAHECGGQAPVQEAPGRLQLWSAETVLCVVATAPVAETTVPAPASCSWTWTAFGKQPTRFHGLSS
jgi:hypothetical protein